MKTIILCLTLILVSFVASAQKQSFKNFKKYGNWIVPAENFEQIFDSIKQEVLLNDIYVGDCVMQATDSLVDWLNHMNLSILEKKEFMLYKEYKEYKEHMRSLGKEMQPNLFEKWRPLIPETLVKRFRENEKNLTILYDHYFEAYALVNNKGEILSVYFKISPVMLDVVKEEELLMICDSVMKKKLDIEELVFRRPTNKQMKKTVEGMVGKGKSGEENWDSMVNMNRQGIPCVYGCVEFFNMSIGDGIKPGDGKGNNKDMDKNRFL